MGIAQHTDRSGKSSSARLLSRGYGRGKKNLSERQELLLISTAGRVQKIRQHEGER